MPTTSREGRKEREEKKRKRKEKKKGDIPFTIVYPSNRSKSNEDINLGGEFRVLVSDKAHHRPLRVTHV